jgi:hypothetical protein
VKKSCEGKLDLRVAFVGYRDHDFVERFVIKDFDDDSVMVFGASAPKQYKTDYLVFNNKNKTIVFKNENTKIIDGNYVFPKSNIFADI